MGVDSRKAPPLPAPTETESNTSPTELTATELSKPGDEKSSYSIPDDGTPVTIRTRGHRSNKSQTSLLIEYFEGGKSSASGATANTERRPSVRVRLTPSRKGKGDHIQVTESKGSRKTSVTRRIPLDHGREIDLDDEGEDANSMTSYVSQTEESTVSREPIDIEIDHRRRRPRRPASPLIPSTTDSILPANASEISAIPADSFLDGSGPSTDFKRSSSPSRWETAAAAAGAGAVAGAAAERLSSKNRSGGRDRVKTSEKSREKSDRKRRPKSRTTSVSEYSVDEQRPPRHRSSRGAQESAVSAADPSVLSSNISMDAHSMRSGVSKTSINNPKLLETVEDAIRRLILPELSALKREQSKRESRRGSISLTETSVSREDLTLDRRRSSGQRTDVSRDGSKKERRNREARHDYGDSSPLTISRESIHDDYQEHDDVPSTPKRVDMLKAAAAGAAVGAGLSALDDKTQSEDRRTRDRRRRRTDGTRSRSLGRDRYAEEYDDEEWTPAPPAPPMPLMSEINPSDITRTSILSAESERPHSASEEMVQDVPRGFAGDVTADPKAAGTLQTLGTSHANVSHGDLTALPRGNKGPAEFAEEYETDEYGRKVPINYGDDYADDDPRDHSDPGDYPDRSFEEEYYHTQDVPPPLKYVPYQAGARGLSPIPSVSGYTEGGSEAQYPRHSRSMHSVASDSYPSPEKSLARNAHGSAHSLNSVPSNMRSREFDQLSMDDRSARSPGAEHRNTVYTEDSELGHSQVGQEVRGIGANPNIIHPPMGVESAVASLVDGSMLEQSVLTSGSGYDYNGPQESQVSYDRRTQSSRGDSPLKYAYGEAPRDIRDDRQPTPGSRSQDPSQDFSEYEIDEHGRKVPRTTTDRHSPTASETAITHGAVEALRAAQEKALQKKNQPSSDGARDFDPSHTMEQEPETWVGAGVGRNKSFKERTMEGFEPRNTPAHSIDRFSYEEPTFAASYMPGQDDAMPDFAYLPDGTRSELSFEQDGPDAERGHSPEQDWSGRATPTPRDAGVEHHDEGVTTPKGVRSPVIGAAAIAAGLGAAAAAAKTHSREPSHDQDDWQRTSTDRKRDTLLTNPYEDASPINNPALSAHLQARGLDGPYDVPYQTGSPGFNTQKYDEGYMSNPSRDFDPKGKLPDLGDHSNALVGDDPFYAPKMDARQLTGMSQGIASPFYDAATGAGIDRIENKDIVALMQHLMVRDAQRSARDTEIVALLMNAALEMRNSFREMKELIQDTGDDVIFSNAENTDKLQKAINGPRPFPGTTGTRSIQSASQSATIDDAASKRKNLWKRALAGLSAKGTSDLSRIEDMLMQLLGEVDVLKTQTAPLPSSGAGQSSENLQVEGQYEQDRGYEPEGISTGSHASPSGHRPVSQNRAHSARSLNEAKYSDNRVSTVQEHEDEYQYDHPSPAADRVETDYLSASQQEPAQRGISVPPESPLHHPSPSQQQALSADNTPRTDRGKKHKSNSSSSWLPKISRWSESTTTSIGKVLRGNKKDSKYDDAQLPSRSGSSLNSYDQEYEHDPYGEDKLHTGFSDPNLATRGGPSDQAGGPQAAYVSPEDPKYKAHRNSINLQHPQPRPGQTERFRNALEFSAQEYDDPSTPKSADWAGSATSLHRLPQNTNRYSTTSSAEPWTSPSGGQSGPPRPPKEPVEGVTPSRARISKLAKNSPLQNQSYESGYGYTSPTGSPKPENRNLSAARGTPTRRPSGPRAMTPKSFEDETARDERRRKRGM